MGMAHGHGPWPIILLFIIYTFPFYIARRAGTPASVYYLLFSI
jgi:hypothetical protein